MHQDRVSASVVLSSAVFFVRFMPCTSSFLILHLASPTVSELVDILIHCTLCRTRYENGIYRLLGKNYSKFLHCFKSKDKLNFFVKFPCYISIVYRFIAEIVFGYKIQETKPGLFKNRIIICSLNIYIYSSLSLH